jgi:hypothetical protein
VDHENGGKRNADPPSVLGVLPNWSTWSPWRRLGVMVGVAVAVAAVIVVLFWPITDLIAAHDVGQITGPARALRLQMARDAARGRLLQLGAGIFAAGALVYTARNFALSRQGQVTDRFTKAVDQLGSKEFDVTIGGIYALERIARDSARDRPTVMEVLAAFVRQHSRETSSLPEGAVITGPSVQTAVTVIGRRDLGGPSQAIDLTGVKLTRANLARANLTGVTLSEADLYRADLTGANLTRATLDQADLTRASVAEANFIHARLLHTDLTEADLTGANLTDADLSTADLTNAKLTGVTLTNADLTDVLFPATETIPEGWERDSDSGRLKRVD